MTSASAFDGQHDGLAADRTDGCDLLPDYFLKRRNEYTSAVPVLCKLAADSAVFADFRCAAVFAEATSGWSPAVSGRRRSWSTAVDRSVRSSR